MHRSSSSMVQAKGDAGGGGPSEVDGRVLASDLDLFTERAINASHQSTKYVKLPTLSNLQNKELSIIEFDVAPTDNYLDLKRTQLELRVRLWRKKGATGELSIFKAGADEEAPGPSNLFFATLVERVELLLGQARVQVNPTDSIYGLRSYVETLLNYGEDAKKSHLTQALYYADSYTGDMDAATSVGYKRRSGMFADGATVCLRGYMNCPLMQQSKLLLNQCALRLVLHLKSPKYCLQYKVADVNDSVAFEIVEANLRLCQVQVDPSIQLGHEAALASGASAKYNIMHPMCNHHTIAANATNFSYQNLFAGEVPSLLYVILQSADRFEGSAAKNCLYLEHGNLGRITVSLNGEIAPVGVMQFDFAKNDFLDGYDSIYSATGTFNKDVGLDLPRSSFKNGFALFAFDLSKNGEGASSEIRDFDSVGNVSIDMHFAKAPKEPMVLTVIGYIKTQLQITRERQIVKSYR